MEGYAELAAQLTALGNPTARFTWTAAAQQSFDTLKQALSSEQVLRTFHPARRAVLTTDASNLAVRYSRGYPNAAKRRGPAESGGVRESQADGSQTELP